MLSPGGREGLLGREPWLLPTEVPRENFLQASTSRSLHCLWQLAPQSVGREWSSHQTSSHSHWVIPQSCQHICAGGTSAKQIRLQKMDHLLCFKKNLFYGNLAAEGKREMISSSEIMTSRVHKEQWLRVLISPINLLLWVVLKDLPCCGFAMGGQMGTGTGCTCWPPISEQEAQLLASCFTACEFWFCRAAFALSPLGHGYKQWCRTALSFRISSWVYRSAVAKPYFYLPSRSLMVGVQPTADCIVAAQATGMFPTSAKQMFTCGRGRQE